MFNRKKETWELHYSFQEDANATNYTPEVANMLFNLSDYSARKLADLTHGTQARLTDTNGMATGLGNPAARDPITRSHPRIPTESSAISDSISAPSPPHRQMPRHSSENLPAPHGFIVCNTANGQIFIPFYRSISQSCEMLNLADVLQPLGIPTTLLPPASDPIISNNIAAEQIQAQHARVRSSSRRIHSQHESTPTPDIASAVPPRRSQRQSTSTPITGQATTRDIDSAAESTEPICTPTF